MRKQELIHKGRVISLYRQKKLLPNGRVAQLELIKHPGAVLIIPFLNKSEIVFIRQFRPVVNKYLYELPAGTLDKYERPYACAHREIIEETGFAAKKMTLIGLIYPVPGYSTEKIIIYRAQGLFPKFAAKDDDEILKPCVFKRHKVKELFKKGRLVDAKTISALAMCGWL